MSGARLDTCVLCPKLCRAACPAAVGSDREAAVPSTIAGVVWKWERGELSREVAAAAATLCLDCGACEEHCHLGQPLPELLRTARRRLVDVPEIGRPEHPEVGGAELVAVETGPRRWSEWLSRYLGRPVGRWLAPQRFGAQWLAHPRFTAQGALLRQMAVDFEVVVADGGVAAALDAAGVPFSWLHQVVPELTEEGVVGSCQCGGDRPLACCGAAEPLASAHPEDARRVGQRFVERAATLNLIDARCASHLRRGGAAVSDAVDRLKALVS